MSWIAWFRFRILGHSEHSFNSSDENSGAWCLPRTLLINWYSSEERAGHSISNNICMTILLQRVAYFSQFVDILLVFGLPPNRICYIFYVFLFQINPAALCLLHKSQKILWGSKLLINTCTCVNSNQFTRALWHQCQISLEEFIKMTGWRRCSCYCARAWGHASALAVSINCITAFICWNVLVIDFFKILSVHVLPLQASIGRKDTMAGELTRFFL